MSSIEMISGPYRTTHHLETSSTEGDATTTPAGKGGPLNLGPIVKVILQILEMLMQKPGGQDAKADPTAKHSAPGDCHGGPGAASPAGPAAGAPAATGTPGAPPASTEPTAPAAPSTSTAPTAPAAPAAAAPAAPAGDNPTGPDLTPQQVATTYKDEIAAASKASGVPKDILAGMIWQESKGRPVPGGGLMQVQPNEFASEGGGDINDPATNIMAGAMKMREMIDRFGDVPTALRGYNSGENGVDPNDLHATPAGTGDPNYVDLVLDAARKSRG